MDITAATSTLFPFGRCRICPPLAPYPSPSLSPSRGVPTTSPSRNLGVAGSRQGFAAPGPHPARPPLFISLLPLSVYLSWVPSQSRVPLFDSTMYCFWAQVPDAAELDPQGEDALGILPLQHRHRKPQGGQERGPPHRLPQPREHVAGVLARFEEYFPPARLENCCRAGVVLVIRGQDG